LAGKPFVLLLNCTDPNLEQNTALAAELAEKYSCECLAVNCLELSDEDIKNIINRILKCFPIEKYCFRIPEWVEALCDDNAMKKELYKSILEACNGTEKLGNRHCITNKLCGIDNISAADISGIDMAFGSIEIRISMPGILYYETLSSESGFDIKNDRDLIGILSNLSELKTEYDRFHEALEEVNRTGYGIVMPTAEEMKLEEPQVVRQGGRYGVKLKASAPSIHMIKTTIETEVSPAIGGERASEDMINFLIQGFDGDMSRIWESNIFGKSLNDIAGEGLAGKIKAVPNDTRLKLQNTIQRIVNEGSGGLICIIL